MCQPVHINEGTPSLLATRADVYKEGYKMLSECWSSAEIARTALALAHSHCHLCNKGQGSFISFKICPDLWTPSPLISGLE